MLKGIARALFALSLLLIAAGYGWLSSSDHSSHA